MMKPDYFSVRDQITTPSYVFDCDELRNRITMVKQQLGGRVLLCYAMKANAFVIGAISDVIDRYEVCSPGEQRICERAGIDMRKVVLSGVYKAEADIAATVRTHGDTITYTAESLRQFALLNALGTQHQLRLRVLLRVTSGNQFGIDKQDICVLIRDRAQYSGVQIIGIQHFSGTQRKQLARYEEELHDVDELLWYMEKAYGYKAQELEFGPGFYVEYFQGGKPYDEKALLQGFAKLLDGLRFQGKITLELGRFLSAGCGTYYTAIVDQKRNAGIDYCIVDGGIHQMNYFGQMMAMKIPQYRHLYEGERNVQPSPYNICGSLCTVNDNLVKQLPLHSAKVGDILAFANTGAYSMIEGPALFLSRDLPKIYLYSRQGGLRLMRPRLESDVWNYEYEEV